MAKFKDCTKATVTNGAATPRYKARVNCQACCILLNEDEHVIPPGSKRVLVGALVARELMARVVVETLAPPPEGGTSLLLRGWGMAIPLLLTDDDPIMVTVGLCCV